MTLKEFYKFTWKKLILFFLIVIIPLFFILNEMGIKDGPPIDKIWIYLTFILFWPFILIYFLESLIISNMDWIHLVDVPFILFALLLNILYLYSVVSLITKYLKR